MSRINFLPPWVETNLQPAFYDLESGTSLQQTSRMYAKVNQLVRSVNDQNETIADYIQQFIDLREFCEDYFEKLDVQEEINQKLDVMAQDGTLGQILTTYLQPTIDQQNEQIQNLNSRFNEVSQRINTAFNMNPIPVGSTDDMTNQNRVYLLTTTGHWFYYDEGTSAWVDGGAYQSNVEIGEKTITPSQQAQYEGYNLRLEQQSVADWDFNSHGINDSGVIVSAPSGLKCIRSRLPKNSFITIKRSVLTDRFKVGLSTVKPTVNVTVDVINTDASKSFVTFYTGSYEWVIVQYTATDKTADVDVIVENYNKLLRTITAKNLMPFVPVPANTELYNQKLKVSGRGTRGESFEGGAYVNDYTYRSYVFALEENLNYTVEISGGNAFRVALWNDEPIPRVENSDLGSNYLQCRPAVFVHDDPTETTCTFNSGSYKYCTILYATNSSASEAAFSIKADGETHKLSEQWYSQEIGDNGLYIFNPEINSANDYWTMWDARLAFGMRTDLAPVPVQVESQLFVDGTIIAHNNSTTNQAGGFNRWGMHLYEGYARDNHSRMTLLVDKHQNEFGDNKKSCEQYYYTGASHNADAYGNMKLGSDVAKHSFAFSRDKMVASGVIDCLFPIQIARINPYADIDDTYTTVAQADTAHEPETDAAANIKCLKWIYLKNATNGAMFYDKVRDKLVVKINGSWQDVNTTPVPAGTYNFE